MASMDIKYSWEGVRKEIFNQLADVQTERLCEYAPKMLERAYKQRDFSNDTYNLADSYVWAVYYKGKLADSGYLWQGATASVPAKYHGQDVEGRKLANEFVDGYTPQTDVGWDMVIAATTPYAPILEKGNTGNPARKFMVISSVYDDIVEDFGNSAKITKFGIR